MCVDEPALEGLQSILEYTGGIVEVGRPVANGARTSRAWGHTRQNTMEDNDPCKMQSGDREPETATPVT